ncbi:MAG TPA: hypothetical protein PLD54_04625 [Candidatus Levybacteria bacterium]|nr:hypothetical protein [Candidatus Levybacteria bacterium]
MAKTEEKKVDDGMCPKCGAPLGELKRDVNYSGVLPVVGILKPKKILAVIM